MHRAVRWNRLGACEPTWKGEPAVAREDDRSDARVTGQGLSCVMETIMIKLNYVTELESDLNVVDISWWTADGGFSVRAG